MILCSRGITLTRVDYLAKELALHNQIQNFGLKFSLAQMAV